MKMLKQKTNKKLLQKIVRKKIKMLITWQQRKMIRNK